MKKVIWSIVLSWVCLAFAAAGIGTRDAVSACDGKVYKKGDKIMFGVPKVSGYLFVRTFTKDGKYEAILQITHGMVEFVERYRPFAEFLTENGFMVVGHDHLGHGDSVASREDWGYFAENPSDTVITDMHTLRTMVQKENPGVPYFMMGHSMGSYMLRKYLTIHNDDLRGAIIMGTGCVPDSMTRLGINVCRFLAKIFGWHHRSRLVESLSFGGPYKKYDLSGKTPSNSWLTKDEDIVKFYYNEPRCTFKFTLNGYLGLMEAVFYDNQ